MDMLINILCEEMDIFEHFPSMLDKVKKYLDIELFKSVLIKNDNFIKGLKFLPQSEIILLLENLLTNINKIYTHTMISKEEKMNWIAQLNDLLNDVYHFNYVFNDILNYLNLENLLNYIRLELSDNLPNNNNTLNSVELKHDNFTNLVNCLLKLKSLNIEKVNPTISELFDISKNGLVQLNKLSNKEKKEQPYIVNLNYLKCLQIIKLTILNNINITNTELTDIIPLISDIPYLNYKTTTEHDLPKASELITLMCDCQWSIIDCSVTRIFEDKEVNKDLVIELFNLCMQSIDIMTHESTILVLNTLKIVNKYIINHYNETQNLLIDLNKYKKNIKSLWTILKGNTNENHSHKYTNEHLNLNNYFEVIFEFSKNKYLYKEMEITTHTEKLLTDTCKNSYKIGMVLSLNLINQMKNSNNPSVMINDFIQVLFYCPECSEDEELEETHNLFLEYFNKITSNNNKTKKCLPPMFGILKYIRVLIFDFIVNLNNSDFIHLFFEKLLELNFEQILIKNPQMPASPKHLKKLRLWQVLNLLIMKVEKINNHCIETIWKCMELQNMPSVRKLIELFIIIIILKFPKQLLPDLISHLKNDINQRQQTLNSLLSIAGNVFIYMDKNILLQSYNNTNNSNLIELFNSVFVYSTSNYHTCRIITHVIIKNMINRLYQLNEAIPLLDNVINYLNNCNNIQHWLLKYEDVVILNPINTIEQLYLSTFNEGDSIINDNPNLEFFDIFINDFHSFIYSLFNLHFYVKNLNIFNYYYTNISLNDIIPFIHQFKINYFNIFDSFTNVIDYEIKKNISTPMTSLLEEKTIIEEEEKTIALNEENIFQRKIEPWSEMEISNEINPRLKQNTRQRQSIILIASLVNKIPNLAGLTRTSEIFHIEKLVIPSMNVIETEEFKNISVSAESWIPLEECSPQNLQNYLLEKKQEGYTLLGLEQTNGSKMLNKFTFPDKCCILLGKEKEGIPAELLNVMDECIEIPQLGILRSLNVHVSASIMLYSYTQQKLNSQ